MGIYYDVAGDEVEDCGPEWEEGVYSGGAVAMKADFVEVGVCCEAAETARGLIQNGISMVPRLLGCDGWMFEITRDSAWRSGMSRRRRTSKRTSSGRWSIDARDDGRCRMAMSMVLLTATTMVLVVCSSRCVTRGLPSSNFEPVIGLLKRWPLPLLGREKCRFIAFVHSLNPPLATKQTIEPHRNSVPFEDHIFPHLIYH
jgi:hypothetical protein